MLKTFALRARETPLRLYGPAGLGELMDDAAARDRAAARTSSRCTSSRPGDAVERDGYRMHAFATDHGVPSLGYALVEDERPGRFDLDAARGLGVPEGPMFGLLQHGEAVTLDSGRDDRAPMRSSVRPAPGAARASRATPGRAGRSSRRAVGADLLIHEATFLEEERDRAAETGHTTALQAARLAREAG